MRMVSDTVSPPVALTLARQRTSLPSGERNPPASLVDALRPSLPIEEIGPAEPRKLTTEDLSGPAGADAAEPAGGRP